MFWVDGLFLALIDGHLDEPGFVFGVEGLASGCGYRCRRSLHGLLDGLQLPADLTDEIDGEVPFGLQYPQGVLSSLGPLPRKRNPARRDGRR